MSIKGDYSNKAIIKYKIKVRSLFLFCFLNFPLISLGQSPTFDPHWVLVKHWDFKNMSEASFLIDWEKAPCVRSLDHGNGFVEPQFYFSNNVTLSNEGLIITVKQEEKYERIICYEPDDYTLSDGDPNLRTTYYTSGWIETKPTNYKRYGYIEARLKAPYGYNNFPAFWTYIGHGIQGQNEAEIDIFEFLPAHNWPNSNNLIGTNVHLS